jgi:Fe-S-cluster containining protein
VAEEPTGNRVVFELKLHFEEGSIGAAVPVPDRAMRVADFLPVMQALQDVVTLGVRKDVERRGQRISCRAGCGACCRQPVPISESEAVRLAELVSSMPESRRVRVRARFEEALRKLERRGLLDRLRAFSTVDKPERMRLGGEYFRLGIPCPFLEDESCSIYEHRPLRCREFLVTSPAENCASPNPGNIERPPSPPGPWTVLYRFEDGKGEDEPRWVPLVLALEFSEERTKAPLPAYGAPDMFRNLLAQLSAGVERCGDDEGP